MKTLYRTRGLVHDLIVTRKGAMTTLWSATGIRHTVFDSAAPYLPGLEYARNMLAALAFCPQTQSCLVLGLGGGSIPRMLLAARPQVKVEAVEIDPAVVQLAVRYFDIRSLTRLKIHMEDAAEFLKRCPEIEQYITEAGISLIKIWLEVGQGEQEKRFSARIDDPLRQWKLSPMDLESYRRWYDYSRARDMMLKATDTKWAPWYILRSDDKKRARLNCIRHILSLIPYKRVPNEKIKLPKRSMKGAYDDQASLKGRKFVPEKY